MSLRCLAVEDDRARTLNTGMSLEFASTTVVANPFSMTAQPFTAPGT